MGGITIRAPHDGSVTTSDVRGALVGLDVSESSPVGSNGRQLGVSTTETYGDDDTPHVVVTEAGHAGSWTKASQQAVLDALKNLDGIDATEVDVSGGYES